jgi:D-glycero-alpha-D-manno-heptose-7-phosphate kinase
MVITRTPYRISFFGGGTDYPGWYLKHGGAVLSSTINKYCYLTVRYLPPFHEHRYRIVYRKVEQCQTVQEIEHPAVRAVLQHLGIQRGLEIHHDGDLPARSGMGTSSSFTVGLLLAAHALSGRLVDKRALAKESIHVEQDILQEVVGSQDQVAAAYGGLNHIVFEQNGEISVRPVTINPKRVEHLGDHLMLFYSGIKRTAAEVANTYVDDLESKRQQLRILRELVGEALNVLSGEGDLRTFGDLLHEGWLVKRELSKKVSSSRVDEMYLAARNAGALGGKLTGAGGGGFMLLFVPPDRQAAVREVLRDLLLVPIRFDFDGSRVIYFDPGEDYEALDSARAKCPIMPFREMSDDKKGDGASA